MEVHESYLHVQIFKITSRSYGGIVTIAIIAVRVMAMGIIYDGVARCFSCHEGFPIENWGMVLQ